CWSHMMELAGLHVRVDCSGSKILKLSLTRVSCQDWRALESRLWPRIRNIGFGLVLGMEIYGNSPRGTGKSRRSFPPPLPRSPAMPKTRFGSEPKAQDCIVSKTVRFLITARTKVC